MKLPENLPEIFVQHLPPGLLDALSALPEPPRETKAEMIATVEGWIDIIADKMTVEAGRRPLRDAIKRCVRDGELPTLAVVKAAAKYREVDLALREILAEKEAEGGELPLALSSFRQQAVLRDITVDPKGPNLANYYHRDIAICVLMDFAQVRWPWLRKSQNRASKKVSRSYIVSEALNRRQVANVTPARIVEISDDLDQIAKRLSGLIPNADQ
jgi:hypothetical protein